MNDIISDLERQVAFETRRAKMSGDLLRGLSSLLNLCIVEGESEPKVTPHERNRADLEQRCHRGTSPHFGGRTPGAIWRPESCGLLLSTGNVLGSEAIAVAVVLFQRANVPVLELLQVQELPKKANGVLQASVRKPLVKLSDHGQGVVCDPETHRDAVGVIVCPKSAGLESNRCCRQCPIGWAAVARHYCALVGAAAVGLEWVGDLEQ